MAETLVSEVESAPRAPEDASGRPIDPTAAPAGRSISIRGTRYPVLLPKLRDPRLHVAAVIISVQVLGQAVLGFDVSIAQILLTIGTAAVLELAIVARTQRVIAWPASALLTGNGTALILRVPGTEHGDWWSLKGWPIFVAAAGISLLSKYAIRVGGRHLFNPSNFGLVVIFLVFGSAYADPQDLWWGPWRPGLVFTLVLILVGGLTLSWRLRLFSVAITFWATFAAGIAVLAAGGHAITARWSLGPVEGWDYWLVFVTSPEIVIFVFFMITDPKTAPIGRVARPAYAAAVGVLAAVVAGFQTTEFATKVSLLAALTIVCAFRPLLERWFEERRVLEHRVRWVRSTVPAGSLRLTAGGGALCLALLAASFGAVHLAGSTTRGELRGTVADVQLADAGVRPAVDLPDGAVPEFAIDDDLARIDGVVTEADAQRIARDVAEGLVIEADAVRLGDARLAATATFGARYDELAASIAAQDPDGPIRSTRLDVAQGRVVLLRDPTSPQARPQLGIAVTGTLTEITSDGIGAVQDQRTGPYEGVLLVTEIDGTYLVGAVLPTDTPMLVGGW